MDTWTHGHAHAHAHAHAHMGTHMHMSRAHTWSRTCTRTRTRTYARANVCSGHARIVSPFQIDLDSCTCTGRSGERLAFDMRSAKNEKGNACVSIQRYAHIHIHIYTHVHTHTPVYTHTHDDDRFHKMHTQSRTDIYAYPSQNQTRCIYKAVTKTI